MPQLFQYSAGIAAHTFSLATDIVHNVSESPNGYTVVAAEKYTPKKLEQALSGFASVTMAGKFLGNANLRNIAIENFTRVDLTENSFKNLSIINSNGCDFDTVLVSNLLEFENIGFVKLSNVEVGSDDIEDGTLTVDDDGVGDLSFFGLKYGVKLLSDTKAITNIKSTHIHGDLYIDALEAPISGIWLTVYKEKKELPPILSVGNKTIIDGDIIIDCPEERAIDIKKGAKVSGKLIVNGDVVAETIDPKKGFLIEGTPVEEELED